MSTYYYMTCDDDMTCVLFATNSQGGPLRTSEDSSNWLKNHMNQNIKLVSEHCEDLIDYKELK